MPNNNLKNLLLLIVLLTIASLLSNYDLKTFIAAFLGIILWTNTLIPRYFKRLNSSLNLILIISLYCIVNLLNNGFNLLLLFDLDRISGGTFLLLPPFFAFLDLYVYRFSKILSFFLIPIFILISYLFYINALFLGLIMALFLVYFLPLSSFSFKKLKSLKILKLSTYFKLLDLIKYKRREYNIPKTIFFIGLGITLFIFLVGYSGLFRVTGAREIIWIGHLHHTGIFSRETSNLVGFNFLADKYKMGNTLYFYKNLITNPLLVTKTLVKNPHSTFIGTLTKFGYSAGILSLIMVSKSISKMTKNLNLTANQYISLILLIVLGFLNGKGFLSFNEYNVLLYIGLLSIINSSKYKQN